MQALFLFYCSYKVALEYFKGSIDYRDKGFDMSLTALGNEHIKLSFCTAFMGSFGIENLNGIYM